ncbi:MAG: DNA-directed RNA polymerase subunit omega [Actinobacteria bacterium]|nr:DNA-directed RNA polymerase subunit omega [Actinomycetota bacterium]
MIGKIDYSALINLVGSKYRLCVVSAKRAEQLVDNQVRLRNGKKPLYESELIDEIGKSPLYVALREIEEGYIIPYIPEEEAQIEEVERITAGEIINPYEAEIDANKILADLENMLQEMQTYLNVKEESEEKKVFPNNIELLEETSNQESLEELQEKELSLAEEEEKALEEE